MFHHLNLFLRSLPHTPFPQSPKQKLERKDSIRLDSPTTIHTTFFVLFLINLMKKEEQEEANTGGEKGKVENHPKVLLLPSHFLCWHFPSSGRKISSLNKFYVWLVSFSRSLSIVMCFYLNEKATKKKKEFGRNRKAGGSIPSRKLGQLLINL